MRWHLFCRVVDNLGDVGVCWRLARQLAAEHGHQVTLWVDDLDSFERLNPPAPPGQAPGRLPGLAVEAWSERAPCPDEIDIVVEAFGCRLPPSYVAGMAARPRPPLWINLEHLSAEEWVEGCHGLPSPQAGALPAKYFYFPGFTTGTGGLIRERSLLEDRREFLRGGTAPEAYWRSLGVEPPAGGGLIVSLFCYPENPASRLFDAWSAGSRPVTCLLPRGVAEEAVERFFGADGRAAARLARGNLTLCRVPFQNQEGYDRLLWACDWNFVRGEDSFVRAQWAARPFVWAPYRQQDRAHLAKLEAFLERYARGLGERGRAALGRFSRGWSELEPADLADTWRELAACREMLSEQAERWSRALCAQPDLASRLVAFCAARV